MRIVSICPSNTELIAYLGLIDQLVGVDNYSDWPEEIQQLPRLGPDLDIDMDKLEQLKPDLVVASLSVPGMEKNIEELNRRKLPYVVFQPNSLEEIKENLLELAKLTDTLELGKQVAKTFDEILTQYKTLSEQVQPTSLYWEWWPKPVFTPGKQNWLSYISHLAGGKNIFETEDVASYQTTWEEVHKRNPDHICLVWVGVAQDKVKPKLVIERPNWDSLQAIKEKQIHILDEPLYCRPSPRLLEGLVKLAAIIHPTVYPTYDGKDPILLKLKKDNP